MTQQPDEDAIERAQRRVFEEQEANARSTAGAGPRDEDSADEYATEAAEDAAGEDE
jgi:hypothetical protein